MNTYYNLNYHITEEEFHKLEKLKKMLTTKFVPGSGTKKNEQPNNKKHYRNKGDR